MNTLPKVRILFALPLLFFCQIRSVRHRLRDSLEFGHWIFEHPLIAFLIRVLQALAEAIDELYQRVPQLPRLGILLQLARTHLADLDAQIPDRAVGLVEPTLQGVPFMERLEFFHAGKHVFADHQASDFAVASDRIANPMTVRHPR